MIPDGSGGENVALVTGPLPAWAVNGAPMNGELDGITTLSQAISGAARFVATSIDMLHASEPDAFVAIT